MRLHCRHHSIVWLVSCFLIFKAASPYAQPFTPSADSCTIDNPALFERVTVPVVLEPVILKLLERSPTFRAQCRRILEAWHLRLTIHVTVSALPFPVRATVRRSPLGDLNARIDLTRVPSRYAEWLGHELEHVIETSGRCRHSAAGEAER
jgi:hypothetical protein